MMNRSNRRLVAQRSHKLGPVITGAVITASPDFQSSYSTAALSCGPVSMEIWSRIRKNSDQVWGSCWL